MAKAEQLTPADNIMRYLDTGWYVVLWRNPIGSYSAACVDRDEFWAIRNSNLHPGELADGQPLFHVDEDRITDDFTPTKALIRLADKRLQNNF